MFTLGIVMGGVVGCAPPQSPDAGDDAGPGGDAGSGGDAVDTGITTTADGTTAVDGDGATSQTIPGSASTGTGSAEGTSSSGGRDGGDEPESTGEQAVGCEALRRSCVRLGDTLQRFQLDTGEVLESYEVSFESGSTTDSLAWIGNYVYVCAGGNDPTLRQVDLSSGEEIDSRLTCEAVTDVRGALLVRRGHGPSTREYAYYESFESAIADSPSALPEFPAYSRSIASDGDTLVTTAGNSDRFDTYDVDSEEHRFQRILEEYDHWIYGLEIIEDMLVIQGNFPESSSGKQHLVFDLETGARVCDELELSEFGSPVRGLVCESSQSVIPPTASPSGRGDMGLGADAR